MSYESRNIARVKSRGTTDYTKNRYVRPLPKHVSYSVLRSISKQKPESNFYSEETIVSGQIKTVRRKKLALLLPAYNEELIIATTIKSAIKAGQFKKDIYVVDDHSSDNTRKVAVGLLGEDQVLTVQRSGKAIAVQKAIKKFKIKKNYVWLHIADADSIFSPDYFKIYKKKLDPRKYAVAVGFVQSMRGNWISTYRALSYTYSQHVNRRIQHYTQTISVFPGPITCFRTDILNKLDFDTNSLTEDFDITLQIHRKKLGRIVFIPKAINYTQDPQTLKDFIKQNRRWQRGLFQGLKKYKIGRQAHLIDLSIGYQLLLVLVYMIQLLVLLPMIIGMTGNWMLIPVIIAADFVVNSLIALFSSIAIRRWNLIGAMPYFYFLRWVELIIFIQSFGEVIILKKFQTEETKGWDTSGRRYALSTEALRDVTA